MELKKCSKCNIEKTLDNFVRNKYNHWCKDCRYEWNRNNYKSKHPLENKFMNAKRNYNINRDKFDGLMNKKECSICKIKFKELKDIKIDHCHDSGIVRSVLCIKCNTLLGLINEDLNLLCEVSKYIEKYQYLKPIIK